MLSDSYKSCYSDNLNQIDFECIIIEMGININIYLKLDFISIYIISSYETQ